MIGPTSVLEVAEAAEETSLAGVLLGDSKSDSETVELLGGKGDSLTSKLELVEAIAEVDEV